MNLLAARVITGIARLLVVVGVAAASMVIGAPVAGAEALSSAAAADTLNAMHAGAGVVFRGPENCVGVGSDPDPWADPQLVHFCAVKDVVGALGGPSSGAAPTDFVQTPNRFEFNQPVECTAAGPKADGKHDGCSVITGAATLLRAGLPVRLFGVCAAPQPKDCAVLGTITDQNFTTDGVYLLMDPALVNVHCRYAQDAGRNGCNAGAAYTAGQSRQLCTAQPTNRQCEYGPGDSNAMLAAYSHYCTVEASTCLENQLEAQWNQSSAIAVGYVHRADQPFDCGTARDKAGLFTDAVNAQWGTALPVVQIDLNVATNELAFVDSSANCA